MPNPGQLPTQPFSGTTAPYGRGHGGIDAGLIGDAPGFTTIGGDVLPDEAPVDDGMPPPRVIPGIGPRPGCITPQIIEVGHGLRPSPRPHVVYGLPPCAYP